MKKILAFMLVGLMMAATVAMAQDKEKPAAKAQASGPVTQDQLAELLVKALDLVRFLPAAPTTQQRFEVLMQNGISPAGGWLMGAVVTKADLARVLVQALRREDQVENPNDPQSWIDTLKAMGISLDRLSETIQSVEVLPDAISQDVTLQSTDPLVKGEQLARDDISVQYGVDLNQAPRVFPPEAVTLDELVRMHPELNDLTVDEIIRIFPEIELINGEFHPVNPTPF